MSTPSATSPLPTPQSPATGHLGAGRACPEPATALPWAVDYSGPCALGIVDANETLIATSSMASEDGDADEANATYIVTAANAFPALVAALEAFVDAYENDYDLDGEQIDAARKALAAAKAGGAL